MKVRCSAAIPGGFYYGMPVSPGAEVEVPARLEDRVRRNPELFTPLDVPEPARPAEEQKMRRRGRPPKVTNGHGK